MRTDELRTMAKLERIVLVVGLLVCILLLVCGCGQINDIEKQFQILKDARISALMMETGKEVSLVLPRGCVIRVPAIEKGNDNGPCENPCLRGTHKRLVDVGGAVRQADSPSFGSSSDLSFHARRE